MQCWIRNIHFLIAGAPGSCAVPLCATENDFLSSGTTLRCVRRRIMPRQGSATGYHHTGHRIPIHCTCGVMCVIVCPMAGCLRLCSPPTKRRNCLSKTHGPTEYPPSLSPALGLSCVCVCVVPSMGVFYVYMNE